VAPGLAEQYVHQERWRHWDEALSRVPVAAGQRVLDLGCGVGDVTARLAQIGAGGQLAQALGAAGLRVVSQSVLPDDELSFVGPARPEVLTAWRLRLARMGGLQSFLGPRFLSFERAFLEALASPEHWSSTRVVLVVARKD
jgi:SAM-dependent methyltransferase